jgi:hypothetical protein
MFIERRNAPRRVINRVAQYFANGSQLPRTCLVTDISDTGARLHSEAEMPDVFVLAVSGEGIDIKRECQVMWRLGYELGVEFVDTRDRMR